jgi:hypothetical protein
MLKLVGMMLEGLIVELEVQRPATDWIVGNSCYSGTDAESFTTTDENDIVCGNGNINFPFDLKEKLICSGKTCQASQMAAEVGAGGGVPFLTVNMDYYIVGRHKLLLSKSEFHHFRHKT